MPELGHASKRKSRGSCDENDSADSGWGSSSASIPKAKRRRQHHRSSEEVGDHLQVLGRELSGHNTSIDIVKETLHHCSPNGEKLWALGSNNSTLNGETIYRKSVDSKGEVNRYLKAEEQAGKDTSMPTSISLSTVRTCMETMIRELREARARMLQWMRQELHSMLCEGPATPCVHLRSKEHLRGHRNLEEHLLQSYSTRNNPNVAHVGMQLGTHSNGRSRHEFSAKSDDGGSKAGQESRDDTCAARGSSYGMEVSGKIREDIICKREDMDICKQDSSSNQRIAMGIAGKESADRDASFGACTPGLGHSRETGRMDVPSVKCRKNDFGSGGEGRIKFATQTDLGRNIGDQSFNVQSDICGEMGYGVEPGSTNIEVGYGGSNNGCSLMHFERLCSGKGVDELRSSLGMHNTSTSNQHRMSSRVLNDDETPAFMLPSQAETVDFENSTALNVMWNMMQQGGRNCNQGISSSVVPNLYYDANAKLRSGEVVSRALIGNGTSFDSPFGVIRSASQRNAASSLGRQVPVPVRVANHSLNSVGMPTLVTVQNQVAIQSSTTLQNFLGLNVGVGDLDRQMVPSAYLQETGQKSLSSGKSVGVFISPSVSLAHKKGSGLLSLDMLELNT